MPLSYAFKRVIRSWTLFAALLLGVVLATTFFAGLNVGADTAAKQALDQQLSQVPVDIVVGSGWFRAEPLAYSPGLEAETSVWSSTNATEIADIISNSGIEGITGTEVISRGSWMIQIPENNRTRDFRVVGLLDDSRVHEGLTVTRGSSSLGINETYVWVNSPSAVELEVGDVLSANLSVWLGDGFRIEPEVRYMPVNLTVAGFVELDNKASLIALGHYYYYPSPFYPTGDASQDSVYVEDLLITDWNKTFAKLLDAIYALSPPYGPIDTEILVFLDRGSLIGPWDIATAAEKVRTITFQINNEILDYRAYATSYLENILNRYQSYAQGMRLQFLGLGLPVFFMAWYMATTVSDMSFNLRRREIGLLLTKGFSEGQLLRMFLTEATLIGLIGGLVGLGLSLLLSPFFVGVSGGQWFSGSAVVGIDTIILAVIFSVAVTFLSMYRPARRASQLHAVDALREFRYVEEVKPYKKRWPWIAFLLGAYKIVMWLLGINLFTLTGGPPPVANIVILILLGIWIAFDYYVLSYIGPILFFWGLTKLLIRGSMKFQELATRAAKFLGELGSLATKNVQRNPARTASIAFLIALIIGYSFGTTGSYASERDYAVRQIRFSVGADISVSLTTLANASQTVEQIESLADVSSAVVEYSFEGESSIRWMSIKAVAPEKWLEIAYYEKELFTGNSVETAFHMMATDNDTIILDRSIASSLDLGVDDTIFVTIGSLSRSLTVVGFLGVEPTDRYYILEQRAYYGAYSYVPESLYDEAKDTVSSTGRILVKLRAGDSGEAVADQIRELESDNIGPVYSVAEELQEWQSNVLLSGQVNVQLLGVAFAVIAASMGTALVTLVSLKERAKEASIMSIRGLSFKQLVGMLLTENLAVVVFATVLGSIVGLIIVRGNVAAKNTMPYSSSILSYHMVFPLDTVLILLGCIVLVFAATVIPVIVMSKRYVSRLERIVREA